MIDFIMRPIRALARRILRMELAAMASFVKTLDRQNQDLRENLERLANGNSVGRGAARRLLDRYNKKWGE
jgi:hypothetical protein